MNQIKKQIKLKIRKKNSINLMNNYKIYNHQMKNLKKNQKMLNKN